jgi:hypothetical protein
MKLLVTWWRKSRYPSLLFGTAAGVIVAVLFNDFRVVHAQVSQGKWVVTGVLMAPDGRTKFLRLEDPEMKVVCYSRGAHDDLSGGMSCVKK